MPDFGDRFAQRTKTRPVDLGACQCPGKPHDHDTARVVQQFGQDAVVQIGEAGFTAAAARGGFNMAASELKEVELGLVDWILVDAEGEPVPINADTVAALDQASIAKLIEGLEPALDRAQGPVPNVSGAPSAAGSPESASPIPMIQAPSPSTVS